MFNFWLMMLSVGPIALTAITGYFSWRKLQHRKTFIAAGLGGLWFLAATIAIFLLSHIGVAGTTTPHSLMNDPFFLSAVAFLAVAIGYLSLLRRLMEH
jgi:hypothetical protein